MAHKNRGVISNDERTAAAIFAMGAAVAAGVTVANVVPFIAIVALTTGVAVACAVFPAAYAVPIWLVAGVRASVLEVPTDE